MNSTREHIVETRKAQSKGRYTTITSNRGTFYRSIREQYRDAQDLAECIAQARRERLITERN